MSKKKGIIAAAIAGAAGYVAGVLTAPKSGKETRKDVADAASKFRKDSEENLKGLYSSLSKQAKDLEKKAKTATGKAKTEYKDLAKRAEKAGVKIKEALSELREGTADEETVEKAVREGETTKRKIAAAKRKSGAKKTTAKK